MIAPLLLAASVALAAAPAHGRLTRYEIDAPELKDPHRSVRVYTPPGYDDSAAEPANADAEPCGADEGTAGAEPA